MGINIRQVNDMIENGHIGEYITEFEKEFDGKIHDIAVELAQDICKNRIILISGPSSSGKTTFTKKLEKELDDMGLEAETISLDDFYLPREKAPVKLDGKFDFETIDALDLNEICRCFTMLIEEGAMDMPIFSFRLGKAKEERKHVLLKENTIVLVEGMHALSDAVADCMPTYATTKIYVSIRENLEDHDDVLMEKKNLRLMRRMVRDYKYRGSSPEKTLEMWLDVIQGDILYVEPFERRADIKINSFFPYEAGVLKKWVKELITQVAHTSVFYYQCQNILEKLKFVEEVDETLLPPTSLLREFIGNSIFY